ncbi:ParB/RepB/Spo0J family partition protein [Spiroplasma apis]|uniref:Site-specific DNA-binding protein n=1 Tax=Spiroplasma apis B31 TaxID=1276258 RepID=V5RJS1_SPIAP|nr:ParB/RepB/Spo0J family partition protein [Spiroplasma apis]AHB36819.1 site-specific DNA-binding protein [Spiroplasma apis B31]
MAASKKKYNFKGLDDIFGESVSDIVGVIENDKTIAKSASVNIDINLLKPNPFQPRKVFNEEELTELSESIKIHGLIQPLIINNNNELVAGERRLRASKLAGLKEVPVVILNLSELQMEEFAIVENIQRVDLLDIEEAVAYKKLSKNWKLKQEEIATRVGKSRSHVANIMRLLNLPDNVQKAMMEKKISMGQAKPLLSILNNKVLFDEVFERILTDDLTAREVESLIRKKTKTENTTLESKSQSKESSIIHVENKIMRKLGTRVSIDSGKLVIRYGDTDDLNRILELLGLNDDN